MERVVHVHFLRPESFYGKIDLPEPWNEVDEDEQREWLDLFFQYNQGIRAVEVDEFEVFDV